MKQSSISPSEVDMWAARQLADYDAVRPGTLFAERVLLNESDAYEVQAAVADLRRQRGERMIGYKVGCTSSVIREQLGIDHSISGRLFDTENHQSGAVLSRKKFANLAIEGELAVELAREPTEADIEGSGIPACVDRVFPVIELHNYVLRGEQSSAGELIANNALHAGFVAGKGIRLEECQGEPALKIVSNDHLLEACQGPELIETIRSSLRWLMNVLQERDDRLIGSQVILTGSIPSLIPIDADCLIRVEAPPFGCVEASFVN